MNKNDILKVEITGLGSDGEGICNHEGFIFFVEGALPGDVIDMRILKLRTNFGFGKIERMIVPSPNRITPDCIAFSRCGGCSFQNYSYDEQLQFKSNRIIDCFKRIGKMDVKLEKIISCENWHGYRNKAIYPVANVNGEIKAGMYARRSHNIISLDDCNIQHDSSIPIIKHIVDFMNANGVSAYDETTHTGLVRGIMTRCNADETEIMVVIIINDKKFPLAGKLIDGENGLAETFPSIKCMMMNIHTAQTNVMHGKKNLLMHGRPFIMDRLGNLEFQISPFSFYQINRFLSKDLYDTVVNYAGDTSDKTVVDLYSGIGTIALYIADKAKRVIGVEVIEQSVTDAIINAEQNGITNAEFILGDIDQGIGELIPDSPDIVILDPPRKGCAKNVLEWIGNSFAKKAVYVSCDPATLARDAAILSEYGFCVRKVTALDMFPQTAHTEVVCLLERNNTDV
jgi:23S rRNA (uracil1939-C5)-methyltransferase